MFCGKRVGDTFFSAAGAIVTCGPPCLRRFQLTPLGKLVDRIETLEAQVKSLQSEAKRAIPD